MWTDEPYCRPLETTVHDLVAHEGGARTAMAWALCAVQAAEGWVSNTRLAGVLGLTTAEPGSIASFPSPIFRKPVGHGAILLCDGTSCGLNGGGTVRDAVRARLSIGSGQTTADGRYTLINSGSPGACDHAPPPLPDPTGG
jgi:NADH-quinone oxidoreductase subunit E